MSAHDAAERFARGTGRKIPAPPFRHERTAEEEAAPAPRRRRRAAPEEEEKTYYDERIAPMTTQTAPRSSIANFLVGLMALAMIVAFGLFIAGQFGYSPAAAPHAPPIPPPTPIIRVVAPQSAPAVQSAPVVEQPARPAVAPQAVPQVSPVVEPAAPPTRQIIIVKNGNDPGAAPIVIDRGTKRRSP